MEKTAVMIRRLARLVSLAVVAPMLGCATTFPLPDRLDGGRSYEVSMAVAMQGYNRSYRLHVPKGYRGERPMPLVVVLHGAFSSAAEMERHTGFSDLADREGFVVAYPEGIGILGFLQHWNAGHCCGKAAADGVDDIGFVIGVIDDIKRSLNIDPDRIYMTGFSNGAMLTHRFAAERPGMLAAAAPLAGAVGSRSQAHAPLSRLPAPRASVPIIMLHGEADTRIPYGDSGPGDGPGSREYSSASASSRFWWSNNGCEIHRRAPSAAYPGITIDTWSSCEGGAEVQLLTLHEWGHRWPGLFFTTRMDRDEALYGFDAAEVVWAFFDRHRRPRQSARSSY